MTFFQNFLIFSISLLFSGPLFGAATATSKVSHRTHIMKLETLDAHYGHILFCFQLAKDQKNNKAIAKKLYETGLSILHALPSSYVNIELMININWRLAREYTENNFDYIVKVTELISLLLEQENMPHEHVRTYAEIGCQSNMSLHGYYLGRGWTAGCMYEKDPQKAAAYLKQSVYYQKILAGTV